MSFYSYTFTPAKKIDPKTTRLPVITVFNANGKEIGTYNPSIWELPEKCVAMIVREYELKKAFNNL